MFKDHDHGKVLSHTYCWYISWYAAGTYQCTVLVHTRECCWYIHAAGIYILLVHTRVRCWYILRYTDVCTSSIPWYVPAAYPDMYQQHVCTGDAAGTYQGMLLVHTRKCCWSISGYAAGTNMLLVHIRVCCWYRHSAGTYHGTLLLHTKVHWWYIQRTQTQLCRCVCVW